MMKTMKAMFPYLLLLAANYYIVPLFMVDTGSAMVLLLAVMPCICIGGSFLYGFRNGFHIAYPVLAAALFVPSLFIYYNASAWIYASIFGGAALVGNGLGAWLCKAEPSAKKGE